MSRRLSVIFEKIKAVMVSSGWMLFLHDVTRKILAISLVLSISVFSYIALYSSMMPSEVELADILTVIVSRDCLLFLDSRRRRQLPVQ